MKRFFLTCFLFYSSFLLSLRAQTSPSPNSADILLGLEKLNTTGAVLYIAAHPDDENTRLLAYLAKERKLRTGYLSLTRGDGGQNLIGKEQGDALGLIRTQELLAARRTDGAEQFFTRANDFGFSKNPEESFSIWNKDSILSDVVWAIRKFKPDVIICRFPTTGEGGHGHHTASAILALEAYEAAADPNRFPEQLAYTEIWQAKRIFWNTFNFGTTNTTAPDQLKIDVGIFNPLLGKSYGEIAADSRSNHKSQGFGSAKSRGTMIEYFKLLKGTPVQNDLFEGIDQTWKRMNNEAKTQDLIETCIKHFNPLNPELSVPELLKIYNQLKRIETNTYTNYWLTLKLKETENLLLACSGLWMEAYATDFSGVPGGTVNTTLQIIRRYSGEAKLQKISFWGKSDTLVALPLETNKLVTLRHTDVIPASFSYSNPYWLNEKHGNSVFEIPNHLLIGMPENDPQTKVFFEVELNGTILNVERNLVYKYTDPVKGEIYRPFEILPPATVNLADKAFVFTGPEPRIIQLLVKANVSDVKGTLQVKAPEGWQVIVRHPEFSLAVKGDEVTLECMISPAKNSKDGKLSASLLINGQNYAKSIRRIEYDHIPYQFILSDPEAALVNINLKKAGLNLAYIPGAGDDVPASLKQIGYHVTILTDELLASENLSKYNAIITGVRAYNTNARLQANYQKLMDYVKNGGNLIVQYNTNNQLGAVTAKIGPYPFSISRDRVTDENASVTFVKPLSPALVYPNPITSSDFDGWIQERGIYFAKDWDSNYEPILAMNDPGEKANEGSLLICKFGKGNFVYTGLVFFRELPAGVPGAYRLFVNLISLPARK
jgi:LmbE family N-acetylglucosaminyl deacetylase